MEGAMAHMMETIVREAYDAFAKQDADRLFGFFADDVRFHVPGKSALAGTYEGRGEVTGLFQSIDELTDGTFELEVQHVLADYEFAVVLLLATAERDGEAYEGQDLHVWRIARGKLAELWIRLEDEYAADAFFSSST
jgi:ketosteroid isomerase-like protein